jgi:hypothetical protein
MKVLLTTPIDRRWLLLTRCRPEQVQKMLQFNQVAAIFVGGKSPT